MIVFSLETEPDSDLAGVPAGGRWLTAAARIGMVAYPGDLQRAERGTVEVDGRRGRQSRPVRRDTEQVTQEGHRCNRTGGRRACDPAEWRGLAEQDVVRHMTGSAQSRDRRADEIAVDDRGLGDHPAADALVLRLQPAALVGLVPDRPLRDAGQKGAVLVLIGVLAGISRPESLDEALELRHVGATEPQRTDASMAVRSPRRDRSCGREQHLHSARGHIAHEPVVAIPVLRRVVGGVRAVEASGPVPGVRVRRDVIPASTTTLTVSTPSRVRSPRAFSLDASVERTRRASSSKIENWLWPACADGATSRTAIVERVAVSPARRQITERAEVGRQCCRPEPPARRIRHGSAQAQASGCPGTSSSRAGL